MTSGQVLNRKHINCDNSWNNMSNQEKLCLKWNDFKETVSSSFGDLRADEDLTDVTLACEDGKQVEAHKVILAASSPFFLEILKRNKHPHPLIYMRGLNSEDLLAVVDFIYFGEAKVFQRSLDSFLALAEELRLKGLTENDSASKEKEPEREAPQMHKKLLLKEEEEHKITSKFEYQESGNPGDKLVAVTNNLFSADLENLDEQIKSMWTKTDIRSDNGKGYFGSCNICGKQALIKNMTSHIEANHITGVSHACDICGKVSRSRDAIRIHKHRAHKTLLQDQN